MEETKSRYEDIILLDALLAFTKTLGCKKLIWKHHSCTAKSFFVSLIFLFIVGIATFLIWGNQIAFLVFYLLRLFCCTKRSETAYFCQCNANLGG